MLIVPERKTTKGKGGRRRTRRKWKPSCRTLITLRVAAVKAPGFGDRRKEMPEDIAVLTGGIVISEERGYKLENGDMAYLGAADAVTIDKDNTTLVGGKGKKEDRRDSTIQIKNIFPKGAGASYFIPLFLKQWLFYCPCRRMYRWQACH